MVVGTLGLMLIDGGRGQLGMGHNWRFSRKTIRFGGQNTVFKGLVLVPMFLGCRQGAEMNPGKHQRF